ncbi:hypothetical protein An01g09370 [Aspergillus niger]|uniref:Uncharacterized protein n=2 Tax=Aspergillus niger TaxID=5061 RepID=A2Q9W8_ASPNC|nr:hypothetical protein An01g09370 [Aspergillus niger]CAK43987.1 hypothetical protein An01g09370 [Aspergillus niger]
MTYACRILDKAQKTGGKANEENPKIGATQAKRNAKRGDEDEATYGSAFAIQCNGSLSRNGSGLGLGTS